jgi:hypothetical protein
MPGAVRALLRAVGIRALLAREWWQSGVTYRGLSRVRVKNYMRDRKGVIYPRRG